MARTEILKLTDISASYGLVEVLHDIHLTVNEGEILALIGSNGAGKSTTLRVISGLLAPLSGQVLFEGKRIDGLEPHEITLQGIAHVPEGRRLFGNLTARENLILGGYTLKPEMVADNLELVYELFPILKERSRQLASTMSGGEQQMLAVGRAMMSSPKLLLLDEPSLGLMPTLVTQLFETIQALREHSTILLVEQNVSLALEIADRGYVLENGRLVLEGLSSELKDDEHVREAYLGLELAVEG